VSPAALAGALLVDKAPGMTSHDVVQRVRRALSERRVGHGGTLDPDATGLLVCAVGRATRLLRYVGELVLGVETDTLDAAGAVTARHEMAGVSLEDVREVATRFVGRIEQVPPMVSAVKVGGERLYAIARRGEEVERKARSVEISRLDVAETADAGVFALSLDCSSGTYVRQLAADLGHALGGGAHLRHLRRVRIGAFEVERAHPLEDIDAEGLLAPLALVSHLGVVEVDAEVAQRLSTGAVVTPAELGAEGVVAVVRDDGQLVGVWREVAPGRMKPEVVLLDAAAR